MRNARHFLTRVSGILILTALWALFIRLFDVPAFILPGPVDVVSSLVQHRAILLSATWVTSQTILESLALAAIGGVGLAVVLISSEWLEDLLSPIVVAVQVTPVVAVAPLILIYAPTPRSAQLLCAFIVSFFPIAINTLHGFKSFDRNHEDLLTTYNASAWQKLICLKIPAALPSFFAGLKIAGGLALVGAVVSEFVAGQAGSNAGLAFRLLEAQNRLHTSDAFACVLLLATMGTVIFSAVDWLSRLTLRNWHIG